MAMSLAVAATASCGPRRHGISSPFNEFAPRGCFNADGEKIVPRMHYAGSFSPNRIRGRSLVLSALPEMAISAVAAVITVGAAATLLRRNPIAFPNENSSSTECEDCSGSGICSLCKGEGFVLKQLSQESADKARLTAKNMATRYTAGLPKKWAYCNRCSGSRNCITCKGSGKILLEV